MSNIVVISTTSFGEYDASPLGMLREEGFEVVLNPYRRKVKPDELTRLAKDAVGLIAGTEPITEEVLLLMNNLKVISRCGTGVDNVDINAAERFGIKVFNTPDATTLAVAELTVSLILNLLRKVNIMDAAIRNGKWEKLMGNLLSGKKVGIIGFGKIGQKVAELLRPFNCDIQYYDIRTEDLRSEFGKVELRELLKESDIISIHVSSKEQIIGKEEFRSVKKGSWLVNVSRGGLIDEETLYDVLKKGDIAGAAIDVFAQEPYSGPLIELDNVVLTPHIGSYAVESRIEMEKEAVRNLLKGLGV